MAEKEKGDLIAEEDIVRECELKGLDESKTEEVLTKLNRTGDIFSPKRGFYSKMPK